MTFQIPKIIGHRGAAGYAPENTLVSIQTAADMGIDWVELDVKLTSDDVPIIFHDDNLIRTTDHDALVKDTPYSVIKELDAGSWFADSFVGEQKCWVAIGRLDTYSMKPPKIGAIWPNIWAQKQLISTAIAMT